MEALQNLLKPEHTLEDYQVEGVKYALTHHHSINASGMGTGKTLMALTTAFFHQRKHFFPVLLVVPACVRHHWEMEIHKFSATPKKVAQLRLCDVPKDADFAICTYDYLRTKHKCLQDKFHMIIFDEAHALKNMDAKITQRAHEFMEREEFPVCLMLTGTPIKNKISELYSLLCLTAYNPRKTSGVDVIEEYSFYEFCNRFCFVEMINIGQARRVRNYYGLKNKELLNTLLEGKYFRIDAKVLGLQEPSNSFIDINFDKEDELIAEWEKFNKNKGVDPRVKKEAAIFASKFSGRYANELISAGCGPVVIFTDHVDSAEGIAKSIGRKCGFIHGGVGDSVRTSLVDKFQNGHLDAIILTYGTSSTGLNLQNANQMILNDLPWVPEDLSQALARINRKGQTERCYYHYMMGGKMEKHIREKVLNRKKQTLEQFHGNN